MSASAVLLKCGGQTDTGLVREHNEDRLLLLPDAGVFAVVDGMGGKAAGEKAAEIAVAVLKANLDSAVLLDPVLQVHRAIVAANNEIYRMAEANSDWAGMACVLTVAVVRGRKVIVGHVGDSRLYKLDRENIQKLTKDHSPVGEREDARELTELQAMRHPRRNEVFRDVGSELRGEHDSNFVDVFEAAFEPDSAILLCSDGLTDIVTAARIHEVVAANAGDPAQSSRELIRVANQAGGRDNITAIVVEGPAFEKSVKSFMPARAGQKAARTARTVLRPLFSRPVVFMYGALAGVGLFFYIQVISNQSDAIRASATPAPQTLRVTAAAGSPFSTISSALLAAKPGDRVEVEPGEYAESVVLPNRVTLISIIPQGAVIRPKPSATGEVTALVIQGVQAGAVGFRIMAGEHGLHFGVRLRDANVLLEDLEINSASMAGIQIEGNTAGSIRGNYIDAGTGTSLVVRGTNDVQIALNWIGRSPGSQPTIEVAEDSFANIVRNLVEGDSKTHVRAPPSLLGTISKNNRFFLEQPQRLTVTHPRTDSRKDSN
jgi:serine/threonine protein phosphatase PrpC